MRLLTTLPPFCLLSVLVAQSGVASRPASEPGTVRERLLRATAAFADRKLGAGSGIEFAGTLLPLAEVEARVREQSPDLASAPALAIALADDVIRVVLKESLRRGGSWDEDAIEVKFAAHAAQYDATPFTTAIIAKSFKGYPSLDSYRERYALLAAFEATIAPEATEAALAAHLAAEQAFFGGQTIEVSLLRFVLDNASAPAKAEARARSALAALQGGATFAQLLAKCDPVPTSLDKPCTWNVLRTGLGESEFTGLAGGRSVAEELLVRAKVGEVVGPLRGVDALWIARVEKRTPPAKRVALGGNVTELVRQVWVEARFLAWSRTELERTVLRVHAR